uniref:G domain-containing protein n=1 Tax=Strongyloides papillosus TaxID=174720 RepID=A0A0N5BPT9_STREA
MTMFFEKNINPLIYTKISYWRGIETLKKTTLMIVGEKGTGKSTFANKLLKAGAKNSDIKMFPQKSINFIHYSLKENKWQCPFEKKYFELTKWGSRLGRTFTKYNTTICYKEKNEFLDQYNIIDCSTFESKTNKIVKRNITVTESENVTSNDSFIKQSNIPSENEGIISINEMNEILFSRMDVITVILDNKKFSPTLNNLIESVNSFGKKTLFILNHSDKAKSQKELELKKEILRWYTMDKVNTDTSVRIHCSSFAEKSRIEEVKLFVDSETKKIYQWLDFFKATTINYRVEDILKDFKNSVSQLLMLFIMSRKDKRFINKDESEYQTYINEAQKLANINNLPFDNEFIKESFTYTELPPEKKCVITMFNSDWRQLPEIEYFIEDEKHLDKIKNI